MHRFTQQKLFILITIQVKMSNKFLRNITVVYTQLAYSQTRMLIKTVTSSNTAMNTFTFISYSQCSTDYRNKQLIMQLQS